MEDLDLELNTIEIENEKKLKVKNRFEQLSGDNIVLRKEKDEAEAKIKAEAEARAQAEKERDFYKNFSTLSSKYPGATEYQDKIKEKVDLGYSEEDATLAVLAKEGKLPQVQAPEIPVVYGEVAGGSAPTVMEGDKGLGDMNLEEKRNALMEADKRGEVESALRGR